MNPPPAPPIGSGMQQPADFSDVLDFFDDLDMFSDLATTPMDTSNATSSASYPPPTCHDASTLATPTYPPIAPAAASYFTSSQAEAIDLWEMKDTTPADATTPQMESLLELHVRDSLFNAFDVDLQSIANDVTFGMSAASSPCNSDYDSDPGSLPSSPLLQVLPDDFTDNFGAASRPMKKKKSTSQRQREELAYLRGKVAELEGALTRMNNSKRDAAAPSSTDAALTSTGCSSVALWERMAKRQQEAKDQAELENARLRAKLKEQIRSAKSLERMLRKRQVKHMMGVAQESNSLT